MLCMGTFACVMLMTVHACRWSRNQNPALCMTNLGWGSKEMGLLWWFLIDLAINIAGWAVASVLKVNTLGSLSLEPSSLEL